MTFLIISLQRGGGAVSNSIRVGDTVFEFANKEVLIWGELVSLRRLAHCILIESPVD